MIKIAQTNCFCSEIKRAYINNTTYYISYFVYVGYIYFIREDSCCSRYNLQNSVSSNMWVASLSIMTKIVQIVYTLNVIVQQFWTFFNYADSELWISVVNRINDQSCHVELQNVDRLKMTLTTREKHNSTSTRYEYSQIIYLLFTFFLYFS